MLFVYFIAAISYLHISKCVMLRRGVSLPKAEILDQLLMKFLGRSYSDTSLTNVILGKSGDNKDIDPNGENLDINVLDVHSVKKIINFAKEKHEERKIAELTRRQYESRRYHKVLLDVNDTYVSNKAMDLLVHSIYGTIERMNVTYPFRKKYHKFASYQIAVLYGTVAAIVSKMENLLAQMKAFGWKTHFIWYLIIYEKLLACNIDISNYVEKTFILHKQFIIEKGPQKGSQFEPAGKKDVEEESDFDEEAINGR